MEKLKKYSLLIFVFLMIGLVALVLWQLIEKYRGQFPGGFSGDQADFGAFGDYIGGLINPLISLFTVILLGVSLYQARTGIELLNKQIIDAKNGADEQISLLKRDRDLESIFSIIEFYRSQAERYPESTGNNEYYDKMINAVSWCIRNFVSQR